MTVVRRLGALAALSTLACGCASDPNSAPADDSMEESVEPTKTTGPTPQPPVLADAVADLATTLGVEESAVQVVSLEEVTWRDGSLGCASPGMMYTQALVEGTRMVLRVEGADYEYHAGGTKPPFHCPEPTQ